VGEGLEGGVVNLAVFARVSRTSIKKGHQLFEEKVHRPEKILATPMTADASTIAANS